MSARTVSHKLKPNTLRGSTKKSKVVIAILAVAMVASLASVAGAQESIRITTAHEFMAGTTLLPAGSYVIRRISSDGAGVLLIRSLDNKASAFLVPQAFESNDDGRAEVRFSQNGLAFALTQVTTSAGIFT